MRSAWVRLGLLCLAVIAAAVAVGGGSAGNPGNRVATGTFDALPGPGRVTYGENIAYRATFTNEGGSQFTKVTFRQSVPIANGVPAKLETHTCPTTPTIVDGEFRCVFGSLGPLTGDPPQLVVSVVWQVLPLVSNEGCDCLTTTGRWTIKEGVNDPADPNDAFGTKTIVSTVLATGSEEPLEAGGYELPTAAVCDPLGAGNLRTFQTVSLDNKVATTICLPANFPVNATDKGVATTIVEEALDDNNPNGHPGLGRARVCIAALGENCKEDDSHIPFAFSIANPVKFVFRIADAALLKGEKITEVFHNGESLPMCPSTNVNGCYTSIQLNNKTKVWIVQAQAPGNGLWGW